MKKLIAGLGTLAGIDPSVVNVVAVVTKGRDLPDDTLFLNAQGKWISIHGKEEFRIANKDGGIKLEPKFAFEFLEKLEDHTNIQIAIELKGEDIFVENVPEKEEEVLEETKKANLEYLGINMEGDATNRMYSKKSVITVAAVDHVKKTVNIFNGNDMGDVWPVDFTTFKETYVKVPNDYKGRLALECVELVKKKVKLQEFMGTQKFYDLSPEAKDLLYPQERVMSKYIQILGKRMREVGITNFKEIQKDNE